MRVSSNPLLKPPPGMPLNKAHRLSRGLVGAWLFNDTPALLGAAQDSSLSQKHGTLVNQTDSIPGKFGNALFFDGVNDHVSFGTPAAIMPAHISIVVWFNITNAPGTWSHLYGSNFTEGAWLTIGHNENKITFYTKTGGAASQDAWLDAGNLFSSGTWQQVVATWGGVTKRIYQNGLLTDSKTPADPGDLNWSGAADIRLGTDDSSANDFDGLIDHVLVYNRALIPSEIASLHKKPFQMFSQPDVELWAPASGAVSVTVTPSALALTAAVNAPVVTNFETVTPSALPITAGLNAPTIVGDVVVSPSALALTAALNAPVVIGDVAVTPSALPLTASIPAPTVIGDVAVSVSALALNASLPAPTVTGTAVVSPSALAMTAGLNAPVIDITGSVTFLATVLALTAAVKAPTINTGVALGVRGHAMNDVFDGAMVG